MIQSNKACKYILFAFLLTSISSAIWHNYIRVFNIDQLNGVPNKQSVVSLNFKSWFSEEYQHRLEEYVVLNNEFSAFFIRINNQLNFSLFNQLNTPGGVRGKENYLYQSGSAHTYIGDDFLGENVLRAYVEKMKFIQDTLRKLNKEFIYLQAPSKIPYFPEYLPDSLRMKEAKNNNYQLLSKLLAEYKINHIDFRSYFIGLKTKSKYPLFTRTGVHWSKYATAIAIDSLNNFIESTMKLDLPELYWNEVEVSYPKFDDDDMERVANLMFRLSDDKYAYPKFEFGSHENKDTPNVIMIGDSFLGNLYWGQFYKSFDPHSQFWFYNVSVFTPQSTYVIHQYQLDQIAMLKKSDVVILGCTESNIRGRSWKFIDNTYDYFVGRNNHKVEIKKYAARIDSCKSTINEADFNKINKISKEQKISIDSAQAVFCMWKLNRNIYW